MEQETPEHLKHCATETIPGKTFVTRPDYPVEQAVIEGQSAADADARILAARDSRQNRPLTYLACPYSSSDAAEKEWRYHQVTLAASWLTAHEGMTVFSPITHSHPMHTIGKCAGDWKFWERIDRDFLSASRKMIVLLLSGWQESVGLQAEIKLAREQEIPVKFLIPTTEDGSEYQQDASPFGYSLLSFKRAKKMEPPMVLAPLGFGVFPLDSKPAAQETVAGQINWEIFRTLKADVGKVPAGMSNPKDLVGDTKPQLHLVPPTALVRCAKVMELGAKKYGPYNWRGNKVRRTVYLSAAMRHLAEDLDGESTDIESLQSHVAHAMACCAIIIDSEETGNQIDDRPVAGTTAKLIRELTVKTWRSI